MLLQEIFKSIVLKTDNKFKYSIISPGKISLIKDALELLLAEIFAGLELIKSGSPYSYPELYYWHREAKSSNAEIDFIVQGKNRIIPIEAKAGSKGQMQSLYIFLEERTISEGIRLSAENLADFGKIITVPLYAVSRIRDIL